MLTLRLARDLHPARARLGSILHINERISWHEMGARATPPCRPLVRQGQTRNGSGQLEPLEPCLFNSLLLWRTAVAVLWRREHEHHASRAGPEMRFSSQLQQWQRRVARFWDFIPRAGLDI